MLIKHNNQEPRINPSAYVASNAVICGDVRVGKNSRIMFGAQIIDENGPVVIGDNCIILENAVIRGTEGHPVSIGNNCLVGPNTHIAGCTLEDNVFIATGASVFHGAVVRKGAEVRINGVVHIKTVIPENETVPINWVAVGDPMNLFPSNKHDAIWEVQKTLNFPKSVYGIERKAGESKMPDVCKVMTERLGSHRDDEIIRR